jgi:hypothetical protein
MKEHAGRISFDRIPRKIFKISLDEKRSLGRPLK